MKQLLILISILYNSFIFGQNEYIEIEKIRAQKIKRYQDSIYSNQLDSLKKYEKLVFDKKSSNKIYINSIELVEGYIYTNLNIEFLNTNRKRIKYITFNVQGYNRVEDLVGSTKKLKLIGPFEYNRIYKANFDNSWLVNDHVEYCKLKSIDIQYSDNTILKNITCLFSDEETKYYVNKYKLFQTYE